jgi:carboxyl-terminal processing protease
MALPKRKLVAAATTLLTTTMLTAAVAILGVGIHLSKSWAGFQDSPKELIDEVWQVIDREYVDGTFNGVDWRAVRKEYLSKDYKSPKETYTAIREMLKKLDDPYTRFMDPDQFKTMQIETSGELTGVGIQIAEDEKTKKITIISPIEGSPAAAAGVLAKDVLIKIDGKSTKGMDVNQAVALIRGAVNTKVKLTVQRGDRELSFDLMRQKIEIHPVRASLREGPTGPVGYIRLVQFSANAASEMRDAIKKLEQQGAEGYVLDLRSNPGGLLFASAEIARMFMDKGTIVSTKDRQGFSDLMRAGRGNLTLKPLVVLIDGGSASASEILAGALQDNKRATLIGDKTFGKGLVQSVQPLGENTGIAVTIAHYYTPSGRDINKKGIEPDIVVKVTDEQRQKLTRDDVATAKDPQYSKAIAVLNDVILAQKGQPAPSVQTEVAPESTSPQTNVTPKVPEKTNL